MSCRNALIVLVTLSVAGARHSATAQTIERQPVLTLPRIFADGMVIQRDKPITIWGWTAPGADVSVSFHGTKARAHAASSGAWSTSLLSGHAGGPFELSVISGTDSIIVHDVLIGDVWVASGQSNMEFEVWQGNNATGEIAAANDPWIREFKIPTSYSTSPERDLAGGSWSPADPQHAGAFSAVAYFFARDLRKTVDVPIGIVNATWGGSNIETWISRPAARITDADWAVIQQREATRFDAIKDSLRTKLGELPTKDAGFVDGRAVWADPSLDDGGWSTIRVPGYWEGQGYSGMDGVAWYRLTFDVSASEAQQDATISMVAIDDDDVTWLNGVRIGQTTGYNVARSYHVSANALHAGRNVLVVRVADGGGGGGINAPASLVFNDGTARSLAGDWKFKVGEVSFKPDGQQINKVPSVLYNKMVYPILPFAIKGVIWYQGESNANNMQQAAAYRGQFTTLINSWRREWTGGAAKAGPFPFLWVQLPGYNPADTVPPLNAAWSAQRESMTAALSLPMTGQAIAIDVGEADNIHPRNKQDVGARLARVARKVVYGEKIVASGPLYRSHAIRGDTIVVDFSSVADGLKTKSGDSAVGGFAIAGADKKLVWANAQIVGSTVHVWAPGVSKPVAVRYAWDDNPDRANLYNSDGLPAAPFRTDRW